MGGGGWVKMDQPPTAEEDGAKNEERGAVEAGREGGRVVSSMEQMRRGV